MQHVLELIYLTLSFPTTTHDFHANNDKKKFPSKHSFTLINNIIPKFFLYFKNKLVLIAKFFNYKNNNKIIKEI